MVRDQKGKTKRVYRWYATPWEILRQLPGLASHLKENVTADQLEHIAGRQSDTSAAIAMQKAKEQLFASFARKKTA